MSEGSGATLLQRLALLLQTLWVGGLWVMVLVVMPGLFKTALAPILSEAVVSDLAPRIVIVATVSVLLQCVLMARLYFLAGLLRSTAGQFALLSLLFGAAYLGVHYQAPAALKVLSFCYFGMSVCGLFLVLQQVPRRLH